MEAFGEILKDLLSADFSKVAGIFGLFFFPLGVTTDEIRLWIVRIPPRDRLGRGCALAFSLIFILVPLLSEVFGTSIGLINIARPNSENPSTIVKEGNAGGSLLIGSALAQAKSIKVTASQRSVTDLTRSFGGPPWALYVGDIHLSSRNVVLVFRNPADGSIKAGAGYSVEKIRTTLQPSDIVAVGAVKKGGRLNFSHETGKYELTVKSVVWNLIGDDTMTVSIRKM